MKKLILKQDWINHLVSKTGSSKCPFCSHKEWDIQTDSDGYCVESQVLDQTFVADLNEAFVRAAESFETGTVPKEEPSKGPTSYLESVIVVRCEHCGFISLFDRNSIGGKIDGK